MGLIRKSLYLGTGGLVAPNSKKQRQQAQILAAMQGATPKEVRRAGGRYDFDGFWGQPPASVARRSAERQKPSAERQKPSGSPEVRASSEAAIGPKPPSERGWNLASIEPPTGKPDECPRCHRRGPYVGTPGKPHNTKGRKWCPGTTEVDYVYRDGYLHPVLEQRHINMDEPAPELATTRGAAERLAEVTRLHDAGLLTDEEYQAKRAKIIDEL